jgi:hypothetical protein
VGREDHELFVHSNVSEVRDCFVGFYISLWCFHLIDCTNFQSYRHLMGMIISVILWDREGLTVRLRLNFIVNFHYSRKHTTVRHMVVS